VSDRSSEHATAVCPRNFTLSAYWERRTSTSTSFAESETSKTLGQTFRLAEIYGCFTKASTPLANRSVKRSGIVVDPVLYLQNATFVTGKNIRVDGGVQAGR
jgi:hypothetical protein